MYTTRQTAPPGTWLLYDGECGICQRTAKFVAPLLLRHKIQIAPLQSAWVKETLHLPEPEIVSEIRLVAPGGIHVHGPDVYRAVLRKIWWLYPVYLLSRVPLLRRIFDWSYHSVAANRHRISSTCGITTDQPNAV